jgi:deoxyribodipyrimidine photo-lyase
VTRGVHGFRNDLRLQDNTALNALVQRAEQWLPVFVLDPELARQQSSCGPRMRFLLECMERLGRALEKRGVPLSMRAGRPEQVSPRPRREAGAQLLSFNEDITPCARRRDTALRKAWKGTRPSCCRAWIT